MLFTGYWRGAGYNELATSDGTKHDGGGYQGEDGQGLNTEMTRVFGFCFTTKNI